MTVAGVSKTTGSGDAHWSVVAGGGYGEYVNNGPACVHGLAWRNATSGNVVVWYMDQAGNRVAGTFTTPAAPAPDPTGRSVAGPR